MHRRSSHTLTWRSCDAERCAKAQFDIKGALKEQAAPRQPHPEMLQSMMRAVAGELHHSMSMLSLNPSCSNAGLHANLIMGGGPQTKICSE